MVVEFWLPVGVWSQGLQPRMEEREEDLDTSKNELQKGEVGQDREVRWSARSPLH